MRWYIQCVCAKSQTDFKRALIYSVYLCINQNFMIVLSEGFRYVEVLFGCSCLERPKSNLFCCLLFRRSKILVNDNDRLLIELVESCLKEFERGSSWVSGQCTYCPGFDFPWMYEAYWSRLSLCSNELHFNRLYFSYLYSNTWTNDSCFYELVWAFTSQMSYAEKVRGEYVESFFYLESANLINLNLYHLGFIEW